MDSVEQVFERIMKAQNWKKQDLAAYLEIDSTILSQKLGAHWNAHWRAFMRLLPLMLQLKIVTQDGVYVMSDKCKADNDPEKDPNKLKSQNNSAKNDDPITPIMSTFLTIPIILQ